MFTPINGGNGPDNPHRKAYELQITLFMVIAVLVFLAAIYYAIHYIVIGSNPLSNPYIVGIGVSALYSAIRTYKAKQRGKK